MAAFQSIGENPALGLIFPVIARAIGVLASIVGVFMVRAKETDRSGLPAIRRGFITAGVLTVIGTLLVALLYVGNGDFNEGWRVFAAVCVGLVLAQAVSYLTEYFTSTETKPVQQIAEATKTGPATTILQGTSLGLESSVYSVIAIAIAIGVAIALGGGNLPFSLYLVALCGMGMLATTGVVVSEDTFGPVADNAAGIAEMSGEFHGEPQRIMVALDATGNTTKAVTKGFAIGSAVIAAVALFAIVRRDDRRVVVRGRDDRGADHDVARRGRLLPDQRGRPKGVHRPAASAGRCRSCSAGWRSRPSAGRPASWSRRYGGSSPTARS